MTKVRILLCPSNVLGEVFFNDKPLELVKENLARYTDAGTFETELTGEDAAEEAFDLTNNPGRQREREKKYGRGRSVSSGDVVEVDGVQWACMSIGWEKL